MKADQFTSFTSMLIARQGFDAANLYPSLKKDAFILAVRRVFVNRQAINVYGAIQALICDPAR